MGLFRLQTITLPGLGPAKDFELYARNITFPAHERRHGGAVHFFRGDRVSFDTFFNGLSVDRWRGETQIDNVWLVLRGCGAFTVRFGLHQAESHRWLEKRSINFHSGGEIRLKAPSWPELDSGLLYFDIEAETNAILDGGYFATETPPLHEVSLGVVIPHSGHKERLLKTIRRFRDELRSDWICRHRIELIVVDSFGEIAAEEVLGATLLRTQNLGLPGAVARGLIHLEDRWRFTHCLLMADDAAIEMESLRRGFALLSYATHPNIALAGCVFAEDAPTVTREVGAVFDGACRAVKAGLDARALQNLFAVEAPAPEVNYASWRFLAFPLLALKHYPHPVIARGADVLFGLQHAFHIVAMNGVACWIEPPGIKEPPAARYHRTLAQLVLPMAAQEKPDPRFLEALSQRFHNANQSYQYDSAHLITLAIQHVLEGPGFFAAASAIDEAHKQISAFSQVEKPAPIVRPANLSYPRNKKIGSFKNLIRRATLNGHLMPKAFVRKKLMFQPQVDRVDLVEIYKFAGVLYENQGVGFVLRMDRKRFLRERREFQRAMRQLSQSFPKLCARYRDALPTVTGRTFWENVFGRDFEVPPRDAAKIIARIDTQNAGAKTQLIAERAHVTFAIDDAYAPHCGAAIASLLGNIHPEQELTVHILHDQNFSDASRARLSALFKTPEANIDFIQVRAEEFEIFPDNRPHISRATYYRLALHKLLPEDVNKTIYIDADVILADNICQLWVDLGAHFCAACVDEGSLEQSSRLRLPASHIYFNAGVCVFNIEKLRSCDADQLYRDAFLSHKDWITLQDQDILNIAFCNKTLPLPLRWNANARLYRFNELERHYSAADAREAAENPGLIHFTDTSKPWHPSCRHPLTPLYWRWRAQTDWA